MKRLIVQEAFVGEPDPQQEGLAAWGEGDEAVVMRVEGGQMVLVAPPHTPDAQIFDAVQFLALELTLEDGRTLSIGIEGDAVGAYILVGRVRPSARAEYSGGLSTVWAEVA